MAVWRKFPSVHAMRAERWLGEALPGVLDATRAFYWPIPVVGTPGRVYSHKGDLVGSIGAGQFGSLWDWQWDRWRRACRSRQLNTGFAGLSDLLSEANDAGKAQAIPWQKTGIASTTAGNPMTLWYANGSPIAGSAPAALAAGTNCVRTTAGGLGQLDPAGSDTLFLTGLTTQCSGNATTLLLYDRIWHGAPSIAVNTVQTVTMTASRYAGTGASGSSKGNFVTMEVSTVLPATAHTWIMQYNDDAGNAAENGVTETGVSSGIASRIDLNTAGVTPNQWCFSLNSGDVGVSDITQVTLGTVLASGALAMVLGHPMGLFPLGYQTGLPACYDLISGAFNMQRVQVDACLTFLEISKGFTGSYNYSGTLSLVSG